jgi:hypothetical protein
MNIWVFYSFNLLCKLKNYCKPSLKRLPLIPVSDNPDRIMKNEKFCSQLSKYFKRHMGLGARGIRARGLSDCVQGRWRD